MIKEPLFTSAPTFREYVDYQYGVAYADGWNDAMRFIFQQELEKEKPKIKRLFCLNCGAKMSELNNETKNKRGQR